jgi:hypothetical protein
MTTHLKDVFESGCSEWIEERYTHPDVQCDACLKAFFSLPPIMVRENRAEFHDRKSLEFVTAVAVATTSTYARRVTN